MTDFTQLLDRIGRGEANATDELLPLVYDELRAIASRKLADERKAALLQPTALVHEAYVRLVDSAGGSNWSGKTHFYAAAVEAMRRILIDNARKAERLKHGAGRTQLPLADVASTERTDPADILAVDEAIQALAAENPVKAQLVKLRFFAGLSLEEAASQLGISRATASRYWTYSRAWLYDHMDGRSDS